MFSSDSIPLYKVFFPREALEAVSDVLATNQIASGPNVAKFEALFSAFLGNRLLTSTGDISTSLSLCLFLAGVRPGDEVIMSPLVCLSTSCPVINLFANIRWCDVDPMTGNISASSLEVRITPRTKAVVVYHWGGNPADLKAIHAIARAHNIAVIEDAGEAIGAEYCGKKIGATGSDYTVFSFYPNRHLTTIEGGAIAFLREEDYDKARWLKRYGIHQPSFRDREGEINPASDIPVAGWNTYMNNVAATIGIAQMKHLQRICARHQENGLYYDRALGEVPGITLLSRPSNSRSSCWVYTFLVRGRDGLLQKLHNRGVHASKVHLRNDTYTAFGGRAETLKGVDEFSAHCLSIPCGWWVSDGDRVRITDIIRQEL